MQRFYHVARSRWLGTRLLTRDSDHRSSMTAASTARASTAASTAMEASGLVDSNGQPIPRARARANHWTCARWLPPQPGGPVSRVHDWMRLWTGTGIASCPIAGVVRVSGTSTPVNAFVARGEAEGQGCGGCSAGPGHSAGRSNWPMLPDDSSTTAARTPEKRARPCRSDRSWFVVLVW